MAQIGNKLKITRQGVKSFEDSEAKGSISFKSLKEVGEAMDLKFVYGFVHTFNSEILTPVKAVKGMRDVLKKFDRACKDLYSRAVSRIRQPIEALFSWLIEKSHIQKANKVRSTKGLTLHAYGRLDAAFIGLIF